MSEPLPTPRPELRVDPHDGLLAEIQTASGKAVQSFELLAHEVAGSLRVHLLEEGVPVGRLARQASAGAAAGRHRGRRQDVRRWLLLRLLVVRVGFRNIQSHARSLTTHGLDLMAE